MTPLAPSPASPYESDAELTPTTRIDELVLRRLRHRGIRPARLCNDAVFLRRAYLDVIGTLPTAEEAAAFLRDHAPNRRLALVDRLLQRDEYADYWAMKWADLLRVKSEFPIDLWPNAVQSYHRWIRTAIARNMRFDQFARELLTASGSNFRTPPANFYRAIQGRGAGEIAKAVALTFMGTRTDKWPKARLEGMAGFFRQVAYKPTGEWKEEIVLFDPALPAGKRVFPDGKPARIPAGEDPRVVFASWLTSRSNPWFARAIANRVWYWLMGRGIVHEPDDIRPDNPPSNPELLAWLEREVVTSGFDLRRLFRAILCSGAYRLSSAPRSGHPEAAALFASYPVRRLEAEALIDALNQITGTTEKYSSPIPEPFTFIPESQRTIALADGSITSPFLEMFGRPPRDTGLESERNNRPTANQRLHLLNSTHIQRKIESGPAMTAITRARRSARETTESLYLTILSRYPTETERAAATDYISRAATPAAGATDVAWALINGAEFLYRH